MIKSLLSCNQECARARRPWDPFSGSREVFMGSLNEPRYSIRLRLTLATLQFRCIFTHSWSGGRLRVAKMELWLCGPTDGEQVAQKGSHIPLSTSWKLGASTGVVTNREERQARQAEGKAKVQALRMQSGAEADRRRAAGGDRVGVACFKLPQSTPGRSGSHPQKPRGLPTADCGRSPRRDARGEP